MKEQSQKSHLSNKKERCAALALLKVSSQNDS